MLAAMTNEDEDALFCDFAETYHILEWRRLPARTAAKLAVGLPMDSRIKRKLCGIKTDPSRLMIQAAQLDALNMIIAMLSGEEKAPERLTDDMLGTAEKKTRGFESGAAFEKRREEILKGVK